MTHKKICIFSFSQQFSGDECKKNRDNTKSLAACKVS